MTNTLTVKPLAAPIREREFDLVATIVNSLAIADIGPRDGDVLAVSSKYAAIAAGRICDLDGIQASSRAIALARRYNMLPAVAQLALQEAEHIFGGIELGFLLTARAGVISPNAGLDRSNIPSGQAVLLPEDPYRCAWEIFAALRERLGLHLGIVLTDSWLMPGRYGTSGIALGTAGFEPIKDERGKLDLFGNPMAVTQVGVADSLAAAAGVVMGERDQGTPFALLRGADIQLREAALSVDDVAIPWRHCIYIESLAVGLLAEP